MQDQIDGNGRPTLLAHLSFQSGLWSIVPYAVRMNSPSKSSSAPSAPGGSKWPMFRTVARLACAACLVQLAPSQARYAHSSGNWSSYLNGEGATQLDYSRDNKWIVWTSYPERVLWRSEVDRSEER